MSEILDIHTHKKAPQPEAIVSIRLGHDNLPEPDTDDQLYSIGIHPWDIPAFWERSTCLWMWSGIFITMMHGRRTE